MPSNPIYRGVAAMILATICYSINDALIKWLADAFHPLQIIFCRSVCMFLIPLIFVLQKRPGLSIKSSKKGYQALRAILTFLSVLFYVYSFSQLPLTDAYALAYVSPFFMAFFSKPILGESVTPHAWVAILIGFCGVLIIARPGSAVFSLGGLAACIAGILYGISLVMSRKLSQTESDFSITLWSMGACFLGSGIFMPFYWQSPSLNEWALFMALGIAGGLAVMAITQAFRLAPAFIVGPFEYLSFAFGIFFGYILWGDMPNASVITGVFLLIFGGLYLLYQESRIHSLSLDSALPE